MCCFMFFHFEFSTSLLCNKLLVSRAQWGRKQTKVDDNSARCPIQATAKHNARCNWDCEIVDLRTNVPILGPEKCRQGVYCDYELTHLD
jgi:hypothetical protein